MRAERLRVREKQSNQKQSNNGTAAASLFGGGREVRLASPTVGIKKKRQGSLDLLGGALGDSSGWTGQLEKPLRPLSPPPR